MTLLTGKKVGFASPGPSRVQREQLQLRLIQPADPATNPAAAIAVGVEPTVMDALSGVVVMVTPVLGAVAEFAVLAPRTMIWSMSALPAPKVSVIATVPVGWNVVEPTVIGPPVVLMLTVVPPSSVMAPLAVRRPLVGLARPSPVRTALCVMTWAPAVPRLAPIMTFCPNAATVTPLPPSMLTAYSVCTRPRPSATLSAVVAVPWKFIWVVASVSVTLTVPVGNAVATVVPPALLVPTKTLALAAAMLMLTPP